MVRLRRAGFAILLVRCRRRHILGPDEATLDARGPVVAEQHENAAAREVAGREGVSVSERRQFGVDFGETRLDVGVHGRVVRGLLDQAVILGGQGVDLRLSGRIALDPLGIDPRQAMAARIVELRLAPLLSLTGDDLVGERLKLVQRKLVQERNVVQPAAAIFGEEVARHPSAGRLVGLDADKDGAPVKLVGRMHGGAGDVFVETDLLRVALGVDQTGDHAALGDLLSLRQQPQRQPASLPDRHEPEAGHCAGRVALRLDHRLLQETLGCDARGQGFDGLWAVSRLASIARRLLEFVEGDFDLGARDDLDLRHLGHDDLLWGQGCRRTGAPAALPVGETGCASGGALSRGTGCRPVQRAGQMPSAGPKLGGKRARAR
ncbi:hypothetical protein [Phenylobacterium sp. NIBR 498073]|uniref:hypothetical protein n=1 Tax=Phenylobacterium sp. NIBR 498073 TaxID=3015177 RepID=UPI0032B1C00F